VINTHASDLTIYRILSNAPEFVNVNAVAFPAELPSTQHIKCWLETTWGIRASLERVWRVFSHFAQERRERALWNAELESFVARRCA
jgi:hypothetical protein